MVKYTVTEKGNPLNPQAPRKWYANVKSTGDVTPHAFQAPISSEGAETADKFNVDNRYEGSNEIIF